MHCCKRKDPVPSANTVLHRVHSNKENPTNQLSMPFTLIHNTDNSLQEQLESHGAELAAHQYRLMSWRSSIGGGPDDWPSTEEELKAANFGADAGKELSALKEMAQLTAVEKQLMDSNISAGLKVLASRFRHNLGIPELPNDIYEKAIASIPEELSGPYGFEELDLEYWLDYYPVLDKYTATAILKESDTDLFPNFYMFAVGAHFVSQSWSDAELKKWYTYEGFLSTHRPVWPTNNKSDKLAPTKRAKLIARLTLDVVDYSQGNCAHYGHLKRTAELIKNLSLQDLNEQAEQAGINILDRDDKAALVVALVEHIYSDVIEPAVTA